MLKKRISQNTESLPRNSSEGSLRMLRYFDFVAIAFVSILLISNIAAQKLFAFGPFVFTGGIILFPLSYVFGDVLTEVYGYKRTRRVIWAGFVASAFMAIILWIAVLLPPASGWPLQNEFQQILGFLPRIVLASIIAYWAGEFCNSYVLARLKILTQGKYLWTRTIGSTVVGQGVDTALFVLLAFLGEFSTPLLIKTILSGYAFKVFYEALVTPITYLIVNWLKRAEGINIYDVQTDFTPFSLKIDE